MKQNAKFKSWKSPTPKWRGHRFLKFLGLFVLLYPTLSSSDYLVKPKDTLTSIARKNIRGPVYSKKRGSLRRLIALNPQIKNPDLINPGMKIHLPEPEEVLTAREPETIPEREMAAYASKSETNILGAEIDKNFVPHSKVEVELRPFYSRILSTDSYTQGTGSIVSDLNYGLSADWKQFWSEHLETNIGFEVNRYAYQPPSLKSLTSSEGTSTGFHVGLDWEFASNLDLVAELGYSQQLFVRANSTSSYILDRVAIPQASLGLDYQAFEIEPFQFNIDASLIYLAAQETSFGYNVKSGLGYEIGLQLKQQLSSVEIFSRANYQSISQDTSIASRTYTEVGASFGITIPLGSN